MTQDNRATANPIYYNNYLEQYPSTFDFTSEFIFFYSGQNQKWESTEEFIQKMRDDWDKDGEKSIWEIIVEYWIKDNGEATFLEREVERWFNDNIVHNWFGDEAVGQRLKDEFENGFIDSWLDDVNIIPMIEEDKVCESGLFSIFEKDVISHKELDGHNYRKGQFNYVGSIQKSPMMLKLMQFLKEIKVE